MTVRTNKFIASVSRQRAALLVLASLGFVALGAWLIGSFGEVPVSSKHSASEDYFFGWASIILGSLAGISFIPELLGGGEVLRVGHDGVRYRRWSNQLIPWSEIREVTTWAHKRQCGIALHLVRPDGFPGRLVPSLFARANRWFSGGDIQISLVGTDQSFDEAMAAFECFRAVHTLKPPTE